MHIATGTRVAGFSLTTGQETDMGMLINPWALTKMAGILQKHRAKNDARPEWVEERWWDAWRACAYNSQSNPHFDSESGGLRVMDVDPKDYYQYGD